MRLPAALLALGLLAACTCYEPDPGEVALLHRDIARLGSMAKASGTRTAAQLRSITACVTSAQLHVDSVAGSATARAALKAKP